MFCKERYIVSGGSADCLCLYIFYVLTDRKKKTACLLRVFAKGRRNNGKCFLEPYSKAVIAVAGISNLEKANIFLPRSFREAPM